MNSILEDNSSTSNNNINKQLHRNEEENKDLADQDKIKESS